MGGIGAALARGLGKAADVGGDALLQNYQRGEETKAKMSLADHAAALQGKMEEARQRFQSGENALQRTSTEGISAASNTAAAERSAASDAAAGARSAASDAAATERTRITESGTNARAAATRGIQERQLELDTRKQRFTEDNTFPKEVQMQFNASNDRIKGLQSSLTKLDEMTDPGGKERLRVQGLIASEQDKQTGLLDKVEAGKSGNFGGEGGGRAGPARIDRFNPAPGATAGPAAKPAATPQDRPPSASRAPGTQADVDAAMAEKRTPLAEVMAGGRQSRLQEEQALLAELQSKYDAGKKLTSFERSELERLQRSHGR